MMKGMVNLIENKLLELFKQKDSVSMVNDIFPILGTEFDNRIIDEELCNDMRQYVLGLLRTVYSEGIQMIAVPKFGQNQSLGFGGMVVVDVVYEKVIQ